jgi:hypothetical protein
MPYLRGLCQHKSAIHRLVRKVRVFGQSVMLCQQVLLLPTPTGLYACFWWMPVKEYNLSARRIKGIIRRATRVGSGGESEWCVCTWEENVSSCPRKNVCKIKRFLAESDKAET